MKPGSRSIPLLAALALQVPALPAAPLSAVHPEGSHDAELDMLLTREAQRILGVVPRLEGQGADLRASAGIDLRTCRITVRFSRAFVPADNGAGFEDVQAAFRNNLGFLAQQAGCEGETGFLFDGKDIDFFFPEDAVPPSRHPPRIPANPGAPAMVVAAGHGIYFHHGYQDWRAQRDPANGIVEDFITPAFGDALQELLADRSGATVHRVRSSAGERHEPSNAPWWKIAARYHLEQRYPDNPEIWHSLPNSTARDRQRNEDIRSRPLFANHLGVDGLIHLHTNGSDMPTPRGAEAYVHQDKPGDRALADSMLCYMKELIQSQEGYEDYPVKSAAIGGRHGENRLADMPSVIIEIGYHTNPEDALALQDPRFRNASMKGVEKGYRLFREGKGCTPLKVDAIDSILLEAGERRELALDWEGHPRYPVMIETRNAGCPPGWKCSDGKATLPDAGAPARITLACENNGSAPIIWDTRMIDDDGVRSAPVRHLVQCLRRRSQ